MKIRIECTIDEMAEISYELTKRSKTFQSMQKRNNIYNAIITSIVTFAAIYYLSGSLLYGLFVVIITIGVIEMLTPIFQEGSLEKYIRKICDEYFEHNPNHYCEFELNENGISCNSDGVLILFEWSNIESINESPASYLFFTNDLRGFSIQKRAFNTEDEKKEFETFIQQHTDKFKK